MKFIPTCSESSVAFSSGASIPLRLSSSAGNKWLDCQFQLGQNWDKLFAPEEPHSSFSTPPTKGMASPARFERATFGLGNRCYA